MRFLSCLFLFSFANATFAAEPTVYRAGVAVVKITPREPIWMAGYASRNKPADGPIHDLYAKALCLDDDKKMLVLLTSDLIGFPRELAEAVTSEVKMQTGLTRDRLMLTASHTHSGPVLRDNLADMYDLSPTEAKKVRDYNARLKDQLVDVIVRSIENRVPAVLSYGEGDAGFAINRRQATGKGVQIGLNPDGPVDHRVPVLKVESADRNKLFAVAFGYACHNTTLDLYQWSGDYAGFAQAELEKAHPGTVAMFWTGCGADANPTPRRLLAHAVKHGQSLATSVNAVLKTPMTPLTGNLHSQYETIRLDFAAMPTRDQLNADTKSTSFAHRTRAKRLLNDWEKNGSIADHYPHYPVQVWRVGTDLVWVALGGEVVVDYALRVRHELKGQGHLWVAGYANDVMAYIPSARVLHEGGYEADSSMIYYGMPSRWALTTEDRIIEATKRLAKVAK
jgi:neutral ceramidase